MSGDLLRALQDAANGSRARASVVRHPEARRLMIVAARFYDHAAVAVIRAAQAESGTRHFHARNAQGVFFAVPAHNGLKTEIPDVYLRGICRTFGIDFAELKSRL